MKITNYGLIGLINSLNEFSDKKLPQKVSYAITKNIMKLNQEYSYYEKSLKNLFEKYDDCFEKDDKGEIIVQSGNPVVKKEYRNDYNKELTELLNIEIEIELFTIPSSFLDYDDSDKYDVLTPKEIIMLESLLCNTNE